jgi:spore coat polysaccharide biosynthesis protein SpsF (cytidylyltransferase family)
LPGKTLKSFGSVSLLEHIVNRLTTNGIELESICICTPDTEEDKKIVNLAQTIGCRSFCGSENNVAGRVLAAAEYFGIKSFLLVLGDNPWIDVEILPHMLFEKQKYQVPFMVSATPELDLGFDNKRLIHPIGTRLQIIETEFLRDCYTKNRDAIAREHISYLFKDFINNTPSTKYFPEQGFQVEKIHDLNISINTLDDYLRAVDIGNVIGFEASTPLIVSKYLKNGGPK